MFRKPKHTKLIIFLSVLLLSLVLFTLLVTKGNHHRHVSLLKEEIKTKKHTIKKLEHDVDFLKTIKENHERTISSIRETKFFETLHSKEEHNNSSIELAIIVPFRGWWYHRNIFTNFMSSYLKDYGFEAVIVVVTQEDDRPFNRGSLLNVGVLEATKLVPSLKYFVLHDIDRLPMGFVDYGYRELLGMNEELYPEYAGGVLKIDRKIFEGINGFSNCFWGWGEEDDNFYIRIHDSEYGVKYLENGGRIPRRNNTFFHVCHEKQSREDLKKSRSLHRFIYSNRLKNGLQPVYSFEGLSSLHYHVTQRVFNFPSMELSVKFPGPDKDSCYAQYRYIIDEKGTEFFFWKELRPEYGRAPSRFPFMK